MKRCLGRVCHPSFQYGGCWLSNMDQNPDHSELLFRAPFLGYLGAGTLAWHGSNTCQVLAVLLTGASLLWHMKRTAALCLELTPNIRSSCKLICKTWLDQAERVHNVRVVDRFTQRTSRFLFEPNEDVWKRFEKKEVRTIIPDCSMETKS